MHRIFLTRLIKSKWTMFVLLRIFSFLYEPKSEIYVQELQFGLPERSGVPGCSTRLWQFCTPRSTSSSSEQLRKGPHDEPGIDVILQELYVCSSADHGVQVPTLGGLVEYNVTTHEHPCFGCWGPDLVQAVVQHFSEHLPTFWVIWWRGVAEVDSCWMIWDITILPSRMMAVSSKLMSNFKPGKIKNVGHMQYLRRWYQNDVLEVLQCLQLPQLKKHKRITCDKFDYQQQFSFKKLNLIYLAELVKECILRVVVITESELMHALHSLEPFHEPEARVEQRIWTVPVT